MRTIKFWKRVKLQVRAHKITIKKFSEYVLVPRSTLYGWIHFGLAPDVFTAYDIASALGVSLEYLVTGKDKKSERDRMKQTEARRITEVKVKKLVTKLQAEMKNFTA